MRGTVIPKDVAAVAAILALGAVSLVLTRPTPPPQIQDKTQTQEGPKQLDVRYRVEGGLGGLRFVEVQVRGPGEAVIRYQTLGGPVEDRRRPFTQAQHDDLMRRLLAVGFFTVDEVPRMAYYPDMARVAIAATLGDRSNEVRIDGRTRASANLDGVIAALDAIRLAVTPEGVATGD